MVNIIIAYCKNKPLVVYKKGEIIFRPGEQISHVAFVKEGYVRLYKTLESGQEVTINIFKPVFPLSLYYAVTKKENPYYFEAITDLSMYKCPVDEFDEFISSREEIKNEIITYLFEIFELAVDNVAQALAGDAGDKVATLISSIAKKYGVKENDHTKVEFHTTHNIISSLCGLTRETASREIGKLEDLGLIHQRGGHIIVNDLEKLERLRR